MNCPQDVLSMNCKSVDMLKLRTNVCLHLTLAVFFHHSSSLMCLGFNSSILLIKSPFSRQPSHVSSQSFNIFLRSRTLSFFRSMVFRSICFSYRNSQTCLSFFFSFSQILSAGIPQDIGLDISPNIPVAASAVPPRK